MKKLTKKEIIANILILTGETEDNIRTGLMKLTLADLEIELKTIKGMTLLNNAGPKNEEKKMSALEMKKNFVVGSRDAKLSIGSLKKAKPAQEAIAEVKAVGGAVAQDAIPAVKANKKEGIKAQKAVPAVAEVVEVKAVAAQEAKPATLPEQQVHLDSSTQEICDEVRARMADMEFADKFDGQTIMHNGLFRLTFVAENDKIIRAAFKKCKSKDGYNAPGLVALKTAAKAKANAEAEAAKKAAPEVKKEDVAKTPPKAETPNTSGDDDGGWPGEEGGFDKA